VVTSITIGTPSSVPPQLPHSRLHLFRLGPGNAIIDLRDAFLFLLFIGTLTSPNVTLAPSGYLSTVPA
jgi:hypothetical protein